MDQQARSILPKIKRVDGGSRTHHHMNTRKNTSLTVMAYRDQRSAGCHQVSMICYGGDMSVSLPDLNVAEARELAAALLAAADDVEQMLSEPAAPAPAFTGTYEFSRAAR